MKRCFLLPFAASLLWSQTTQPAQTGQTPQPAPTVPEGSSIAASGLKLRGPDAIGQSDPNRVVAVIHGEKVTAGTAYKMLKRLPPDKVAGLKTSAELAKAVESVYIQTKFAEEAEKLKLADSPPYKEQIENFRTGTLFQAYIQYLTQNGYGVSDDDINKYYSDHGSEYEQLKLAAIYVSFVPAGGKPPANGKARTQEEAKAKAADVVVRARSGGDFAMLAKNESDDPNSAAKGGEIGSFSAGKNNLPKDMAAMLTKMNKGDVSDPLEQRTGYWIIRMNDRVRQNLDEVKPQIIEALRGQHANEMMQKTLKEYEIQVSDNDFFAKTPPAAPPSAAGTQPAPKVPSLQNPPPHQ